MDKQPVGQLPDLTQSNNDDEIMVITNSEYNQLKKEKISDFITDLTSTNENNALTKGTDGKMFVTDFGNADNITEGTLPVSVLPDIPKDLLPAIETSDLPNSGVTAGKYIYPTNMQVNNKGQIVSVENGVTADITKEQIDIVTARKLTTTAYTQKQYPDEYSYWVDQAHSTFDLSKFTVVGSPTISEDGILTPTSLNYVYFTGLNLYNASSWKIKDKFVYEEDLSSIQVIFSQANISGIQIYFNQSNKIRFQGSFNGTNWAFDITTNKACIDGQAYYYIIEYTGTQYNLLISTDGLSYEIWASYESTEKISALTEIIRYVIGSSNTANRDFKGTIDLKSFAVWVDGQPVFSGNKTAIDTINDTLEIPYTETTDGTKIVDAAYFDRVQSCREQTGQALYLTLDEQKQQYYLPQGTVSGMISQNKQKIDQNKQGLEELDANLSLKANTSMNNIPAAGKEEVNAWGMPDLTRGVSKSFNTNYTAECNGWLFAQVQCSFTNTELYFDLNIDGKTFNVLTTTMVGGTTSSSAFHPIKKGSVYKGSRSGNASILSQSLIFYPCIGEGV